eukprot:gene4150-biopygen3515
MYMRWRLRRNCSGRLWNPFRHPTPPTRKYHLWNCKCYGFGVAMRVLTPLVVARRRRGGESKSRTRRIRREAYGPGKRPFYPGHSISGIPGRSTGWPPPQFLLSRNSRQC